MKFLIFSFLVFSSIFTKAQLPQKSENYLSKIFYLEEQVNASNKKNYSSANITRGPYLQLPSPTSMDLVWQTDITEIGRVCYSTNMITTENNAIFCVNEVTATTKHHISLNTLTANQRYYYSLGSTPNSVIEVGDKYTFRTPPTSVDNSITTKIWITGDPSEGSYIHRHNNVINGFKTYQAANPSAAELDLWLLLGDNAYTFGLDSEYQSGFFDKYDDDNIGISTSNHIMKQTPIMPCIGNHDYYQGGPISFPEISMLENQNQLSSGPVTVINQFGLANSVSRILKSNHYYDIFKLPTNGYKGKYSTSDNTDKKAYYSYNHNNIHFVCLDSYGFYDNYMLFANMPNAPNTNTNNPQLQWLIADLNSNTQKWTIMYFHHPPYARSGGHYSDLTESDEFILKGIRENLVKYLDEKNYKIDLVIGGHSHSYERSKLLKGHHSSENTYNPTIHNNPNLNPNLNSFATSSGSYNSEGSCPYLKSSEITKANEGIVYVVAGSSAQLQQSTHSNPDGTNLKGHLALNGAQFNIPNSSDRGTIQDQKGGSVYIEVKDNVLISKFIDEDGIVGDQFTIIKDVNITPPNVLQISETDGTDLQNITTPIDWPIPTPTYKLINQYSGLVGTYSTTSIPVITPDIGAIYSITDQYGCVKHDFRFTFNGSCWGNVTINNKFYPTPSPEYVYSSGTITSTSQIINLANVSFIAKNANHLVTTGSGILFQAELGAIFSATINPSIICPPVGL